MAEEFGQGFVTILPDFSQFDAALKSHVTSSLDAIQKQLATAGAGLGTNVGGGGAAVKKEADTANAALKTVQKTADDVGRTLTDKFSKLAFSLNRLGSTLTQVITRPLAGIARDAVGAVSDLVEAVQASEPAFGRAGEGVRDWAATLDNSFGLTQKAALDTANTFGLLFGNIGLTESAAARLAKTLTERAADVGSLFNVQSAKVAQDFTSAIEGQSRTVRKYGVLLSEAAVNQFAYNKGIAEAGTELTQQQKILARSQIILEQTTKAQGDAARTAGTFAGQLRTLTPQIDEARRAIGEALLPVATVLVKTIRTVVEAFDTLNNIPVIGKLVTTIGVSFAGLIAITGPVIFIFARLVDSLRILQVAFGMTAKSATAMGVAEAGAIGPTAALGETAGAAAVGVEGLTAAQVSSSLAGVKFSRIAAILVEGLSKLGAVISRFGPGLATLGAFHFISERFEKDAPKVDKLKRSLDELAATGNVTKDLKDQLTDLNTAVGYLGSNGVQTTIGRGIDRITQHFSFFIGENKLQIARKNVKAFSQAITDLAKAGDVSGAQNQLEALREQYIAGATSVEEMNNRTKEFDRIFKGVWDTILKSPLPELPGQIDRVTTAFDKNKDVIKDLLSASREEADSITQRNNALDRQHEAEAELAALRKKGTVDAEKVASAERAVVEAKEKVTDANNKVTDSLVAQSEAQIKLNELLKPATEDEIAEAKDKVLSAQLALNRANREAEEAQKALNRQQGRSIDLTKLSLDQLRTTLANARATLAAQREGTQGASRAELEDAALSAQIAQREAVRNLAEAQKDLADTENKGKVETEEITKARNDLAAADRAVTKARREAEDAVRDVGIAEAKLRQERAGDPALLQTIHDKEVEVKNAKKDVAAAERDIALAVIERQKQIDILNDKQDAEAVALQRTFDVYKKFGLVVPDVETAINAVIDKIAASLIIGIDASGRQIIKPLTGPRLRGFEEGGLVTSPTLSWIGERFKPESVIPWSSPNRVWEQMAKALPHMPPVVRQRLEPVIPGSTVSSPTHLNRPVAEFDYDRMAKAIAKAIREEGLGADIDITVPPAPGMSESQLARKVAREMGRWMRG